MADDKAGSAAQVAALPMPRREAEIDVPEYEGFKVRLWVNYPNRFKADLKSGDAERVRDMLKKVVLGHNGWADEEGALLPQPGEDAFWDKIPDELAATIIALLNREEGRLPNSVLAR